MVARSSRRWAFLGLAGSVLLLLYTLHSSSGGTSREYINDLVAHWSWRSNKTVSVGLSTATTDELRHANNESRWNFDLWFWQVDLPQYRLPKYDTPKLKSLTPHNYKGPGHEAFATFFASRNNSMHDPYFTAAQQLVYRLLWDPKSKSKHPVIVFVPPFVKQEHRDHFAAAGAIVREVPLVPFEPNDQTSGRVEGRVLDVFSKLGMWNQPDFSRIGYLDCDAFPLVNVDQLLGDAISPEQKCAHDLLRNDDVHRAPEICDSVFSGVPEFTGFINAGVMIFKPNAVIHQMMIRDYKRQDEYDNGFVEQAFLTHFYRKDGPFPPTYFGQEYNGGPDRIEAGEDCFILHDKMWARVFSQQFVQQMFNSTWMDMLKLYESEEFVQMRLLDDAAHGLG